MTKPKPAAPNGRAAKVLEATRRLFRDGFLAGTTARALGLETGADSLSYGDEVNPLIQEAGRCPGFGSDPIDEQIRKYLGNTYGAQGWQRSRDPYKWERGGGDAKLDELFAEEDRLRAEFLRLENVMWQARDDLSATRRQDSGASGIEVVAVATKKLDESIKTWQAAKARLEVCMGRRTDRALQLQETYRRRAAAEGK